MNKTQDILNSVGSLVYESAVVIMGIEENIARLLLLEVLEGLGVDESECDIEAISMLMPLFEQRLRKLLGPEEVRAIMIRLSHFILSWDVVGDRGPGVELFSPVEVSGDDFVQWRSVPTL